MTSPTDVANMGLALLGDARIEDLDDGTPLANLAQIFYAPARDAILSMMDWPFATGWVTLSRIDDDPPARWNYQYAPTITDPAVLMIWELSDTDAVWTYAYEPISNQQVIQTDLLSTTIAARATFRLENTGVWDALVVQALAYKMGADMAVAKSGQSARFNTLRRGMEFWLGQATAKSGKQRAQDVVVSATLNRIRG